MKEVKKEIKKYETVYVSTDGHEFATQEECKRYEQSALGVLMEKYKPLIIKTSNEYELFSVGDEDNIVDIVKISDESEADLIKQIYFLYNAYVLKDDYKLRREETLNTINNSLKGSGILFIGRGCYDADNFYIINSKDEMIDSINSNCDPEENIYD